MSRRSLILCVALICGIGLRPGQVMAQPAGTAPTIRAAELVQVPPQRNLKFTPYVLARPSRSGGLPPGTTRDEEFDCDVKYSLTPSLTFDATYNTDFGQVEVDEQQVNFDRFSLFLPVCAISTSAVFSFIVT